MVLIIATIPRLPRGICFGDSGGLQLAAATLGITHPPGYAGYVSLGHLATLVPGTSPAYMVSLACLGAGLLALLLGILLQVRLGVPTGLAATVALALTAHPRVWANLLAPEVYMPSLALIAGVAYLLAKYSRLGRRRELLLAGLLFGLALANRPPVVLLLPFVLIAWWIAERKRTTSWPRSIRSLLLAAGVAVLPAVYSLGYLLIRDKPETPLNYIQQYNEEFRTLPDSQAGFSARLERAVWHATGRQFHDRLGNTVSGARGRLIWLRNRLLPNRPLTFVIGLILVLFGAVVSFRRCPTSGLLLIGFAIASLVFLCAYRITDDAADFLPLMFAMAVFAGAALSTLFLRQSERQTRLATTFIFIVAAVFTLIHAPRRYPVGRAADARPYLMEIDLPSLPQSAMLCSSWASSCPLWYAQHVLGQRPDIDIINADPGNWPRFIAQDPDRPIFTTSDPGHLDGFTVTPHFPLWQLESSTP